MYRSIEVMTPTYDKLFVAHAPTFDLVLELFREAHKLGLEARLTTGQFYPPEDIGNTVWVSKDDLGTCLRASPYNMIDDWRYCEGKEYQIRAVLDGGNYNNYVLGMFQAYFRSQVAAQIRKGQEELKNTEGQDNAA